MTKINPETFDFSSNLNANKLKGIWQMMKNYRIHYAGAAAALALSATSKTLTYIMLRYFVDQVLTEKVYFFDKLSITLLIIGLGFVGLAVFEGGLSYISGRLAAYTAEGITRQLRDFLYDHIQRLSFSYHAKTPTGELIERVTSDVDAVRRFLNDQAIGVARIIFLFIINFIAIMQLNVKLAFASIIVIPFILGVSIWFFKRVSTSYEDYQKQEAILSTTLQENLTGVRVVKAFARQQFEIEKFETDNWKKFLKGKALLLMHSLFWPLSDIVLGGQMLGGLVFAAILAINGEISIGTYIAYAGLVVWLIWPIRNLGRLIVQTSMGMVSYGRVMKIIQEKREKLTDGKTPADGDLIGELIFDEVGFIYDGGSDKVLNEISFKVAPGQIVALLGSTGSGKTTLVNLLPRFYDYSEGRLLLDGIDLGEYSREYLRQQIGIVEQEPFLFSRSILENITFAVDREVTQEEVEAVAKSASIHDVIVSFPEGYNTLVGEKGVTLSGGQKQRLAIARTLLKNPRILILDDSTSSVDTETEEKIRSALNSLMANRTTFIIAHRIQSVMVADLILVLDKGKIVQRGTHEKLLAEDGIYRQTFEIQTQIDEDLQNELSKNRA
jgi:ATP-binding cassette subfamily B protein